MMVLSVLTILSALNLAHANSLIHKLHSKGFKEKNTAIKSVSKKNLHGLYQFEGVWQGKCTVTDSHYTESEEIEPAKIEVSEDEIRVDGERFSLSEVKHEMYNGWSESHANDTLCFWNEDEKTLNFKITGLYVFNPNEVYYGIDSQIVYRDFFNSTFKIVDQKLMIDAVAVNYEDAEQIDKITMHCDLRQMTE